MKIFNSQIEKKELLHTINKKELRMYVCGITPYDTTHLGHAFTYVTFDVLSRYLTYKGYKVIYTQNVTDIDDDILKKAKEEKRDWKELGDFWTKRFLNDMHSFNITPPTYYVKATDSIPKMLEIIQVLLQKGFAYEKESNVYFDVTKYPEYGKLSHLTPEEMIPISRERGANPEDSLKKNPLDFLLWQKTKKDEPYWQSPWGKGRPGWHIECSSMIAQYLGPQIDVHGGGFDLIYPHHESEIAQSENYTGKIPFVGYWMHVAMLRYKGEKMSKSLGNLVMVDVLLQKYTASAIRYLLLSHHYRDTWEYFEEEMEKAQKNIEYIGKACQIKTKQTSYEVNKKYSERFEYFMEDDLDTPGALRVVMQLAKKVNQTKNYSLQKTLKHLLQVLGFTHL